MCAQCPLQATCLAAWQRTRRSADRQGYSAPAHREVCTRAQVLGLLGLPAADLALVTGDKKAARIHVVAMGQAQMSPEALTARCSAAGYSHVVGFRPTGAPHPFVDRYGRGVVWIVTGGVV